MSNLYVPIDYSQLFKVIPEGEDILYYTKILKIEIIHYFSIKN